MLKPGFWPITARSISQMSQLSVCINLLIGVQTFHSTEVHAKSIWKGQWHNINESQAMKNFHFRLLDQFRKARRDAIAAYATEMAGTRFVLDSDLEAAAIEQLTANRAVGGMEIW